MPTRTVVTGLITNVAGNPASSGYVDFELQPNSNALMYRVSGTAIIAPNSVRAAINTSGLLKAENGTDPLELWGNDTLTPANTFYRASFVPDGVATQKVNLLLIQGASYDLSSPQFYNPAEFVPNLSPPRFQSIESDIIPAYDGQYTLGTDQRYFATAYIRQIFADTLNFLTLSVNNLIVAVKLKIPSYAKAALPASDVTTAGSVARVSDDTRGLWLDTGAGWVAATEFVDARQFGVKADGAIVTGVLTGTNDTAALNLAIAACGKLKTLLLPDGMMILTAGATSQILCSVYGPSTTAIASVYNSDQAIFNVKYDEDYPTTYGSGNTGLNAFKTFEIFQIIGSPDDVRMNQGIYCSGLEYSKIKVSNIRGCSVGVWLDGYNNDKHMGNNTIEVDTLFTCEVGILMWAGATATNHQCELNLIRVRYATGFTNAAFSLAGPQFGTTVDNEFEIGSVGSGSGSANLIMLDELSARNTFTVRSWDSIDTGKYITAPSGSLDNVFKVPLFDLTKITWAGLNILDGQYLSISGSSARSNLYATAIPASGSFRVGDKVWFTNVAAGSPVSATCIVAGTPGTWLASPQSGIDVPVISGLTNLAAATLNALFWTRTGNVVTATFRIVLDPTLAAPTATSCLLTLPVTSNLANPEDLCGVINFYTTPAQNGVIVADISGDKAKIQYMASDLASQEAYGTFSYIAQ